jgi:dethiobiotin synthetase
MSRYFITGIGTGVGKTFVSALLAEALQADYWKPVQCGTENGTDRELVQKLISNSKSVCHPEVYCFAEAASPHLAASLAGQKIQLEHIALPETTNNLIIEGAGGLAVPLNDEDYVIELSRTLDAEVILVCRNYLGCINHSLLSIDYLLHREYQVKGLVLIGSFDKAVKSVITSYAELPVIAELPELTEISRESLLGQIAKVNLSLFDENA